MKHFVWWTFIVATAACGGAGFPACLIQAAPPGTAAKKGQVAEGEITSYRPASEEITHFVLPEGFKICLVAAEPLLINPLSMALDDEGRIYLSESHTYRYEKKRSPVSPPSNPIVRLDPLPCGKGYRRVPVAEGFEDPVMSMVIRDGKLWCTNNDHLYRFELDASGKATNRQTLLVDKNKTWNPFGMYSLEWGADGLLYMSVGNHNIDIRGPTNRVSGRGSSGIVVRMQPDGGNLERLVQGMRAPYPFEYDPFGQLWVLSNGEGNPNRFIRAIAGVDYHCYSRPSVDNRWLAGEHPLAPPCFELPRGACTQLLRYYGAAFPKSFEGNLLLVNWGAHGFGSVNHTIYRYVLDDRGQIVRREAWLVCTDPHFRATQLILAPDGNLLLADWYGRDDESDMTGRIWKISYTKGDKPRVTHQLDSPRFNDDAYVISALDSPHHLIREKAVRLLTVRGNEMVEQLARHAAESKQPLGSAAALWTLLRIGTPASLAAICRGAENADWRIRRLAVNLLRRYQVPTASDVADALSRDEDPAVRVEAALAHPETPQIRNGLIDALQSGAARDAHLRYQAAWHIARTANATTFSRLLSAGDANVLLAGMIAVDVACFENFQTKPWALAALGRAIARSEQSELQMLLTLARINRFDAVPALRKLLSRAHLSPATTAKAIVLLRSMSSREAADLSAAATKRFLEAVRAGSVHLETTTDVLALLQLLEFEGATPFAVGQIGERLGDADREVRLAAHALARKFGPQASALAEWIWPRLLEPAEKTTTEDKIELAATVARVERQPKTENWERLLADAEPLLVKDVVRSWRSFQGKPKMVELLTRHAARIMRRDPSSAGDFAVVLRQVKADPRVLSRLALPSQETNRAVLGKQMLAAQGKNANPLLGRRVFQRAACVKCHTVSSSPTLGPSLKGIGKAQKPEYLVESLLHPSKVIKTGYEVELLETADGRVLSGLVREDGGYLRVLTGEEEMRVEKKRIVRRARQKKSFMPEGQEKELSQSELNDLLSYLISLI